MPVPARANLCVALAARKRAGVTTALQLEPSTQNKDCCWREESQPAYIFVCRHAQQSGWRRHFWPLAEGERDLTSHTNGHGAPPILLTIAGFDPSCGAGVAADLKTFAAHNCYGVAAVTALTVQSTQGVRAIHPTAATTLRAQLDALGEDGPLAGVKIGMLANRANASVVVEFLHRDKYKFARTWCSIRFRARRRAMWNCWTRAGLEISSRCELLKRATRDYSQSRSKAEWLTGMEVKDVAGMKAAAQKTIWKWERARWS